MSDYNDDVANDNVHTSDDDGEESDQEWQV
jgi:hypothetical protein